MLIQFHLIHYRNISLTDLGITRYLLAMEDGPDRRRWPDRRRRPDRRKRYSRAQILIQAQSLISNMSEALKDVKIYCCQCQLLIKRCRAVQEWLDLLERKVPMDSIESSSEMIQLIEVLDRGRRLVTKCQSEKNWFPNKHAEFGNTYKRLTSCMHRASKEINKDKAMRADLIKIANDQDISDKEASKAAIEDQMNINSLVVDVGENLILGELLGQGSHATVYKSQLYDTTVAVKEFEGTADFNMDNEILVLQILGPDVMNRRNILQIFGKCKKGKNTYLVMELMKTDLAKLLKKKSGRESPFTFSTAIDIMSEIAKAIRILHENKIVHRDIKPANILVNIEEGPAARKMQIKVADFGISKTNFRTDSSNLTRYRGTTGYMAPEMFREDLTYTRKVDVYSFGKVCAEILGWKHNGSQESPSLPSTCPEDLRQLITKCCSYHPTERPDFETICSKLQNLRDQKPLARQHGLFSSLNLALTVLLILGYLFPSIIIRPIFLIFSKFTVVILIILLVAFVSLKPR